MTSHCTPNSPSGAPEPRWVTATLWPSAWSLVATARPIPRLPPVTRIVRGVVPCVLSETMPPTLASRAGGPGAGAFRRPAGTHGIRRCAVSEPAAAVMARREPMMSHGREASAFFHS